MAKYIFEWVTQSIGAKTDRDKLTIEAPDYDTAYYLATKQSSIWYRPVLVDTQEVDNESM